MKQSIKLFPKLIWDSGPFLRKFLSESESCIHEIHLKSDLKGFATTVSELCMRMSQKIFQHEHSNHITVSAAKPVAPESEVSCENNWFCFVETPAMIFLLLSSMIQSCHLRR